MRSIYLVIFFITAAVLFFYFVNSFALTINFFGDTAVQPANQTGQKTEGTVSATGTKNFIPGNFNGPSGQPQIIGPSGQPPNY